MPSELQTRAEVESVTRDAIADVEVVNPARAKIEEALTQLGGVGNDRSDTERAPEKAVERNRCAFVVVDLLNPTLDEAYAVAIFEAFDSQRFQVGQDPILITGRGILSVEFHLPDAGQFNVGLGKNFCVGDAGNERPGVLAQVDQPILFERSSRRPKRETEGKMISLAKVMARHDG